MSTLDKCQRNAVEIEKTLLRMRSILQQLENAVTLEVCATERLIYSYKIKKTVKLTILNLTQPTGLLLSLY